MQGTYNKENNHTKTHVTDKKTLYLVQKTNSIQ
jgi:hypothetical protein